MSSAATWKAYHYVVEGDAREGTLVEVLRPYAGRSARFALLQPPERTPSLAVRRFVELLVQRCGR
jgi:DNA-binding transcriptional LysR family regulator